MPKSSLEIFGEELSKQVGEYLETEKALRKVAPIKTIDWTQQDSDIFLRDYEMDIPAGKYPSEKIEAYFNIGIKNLTAKAEAEAIAKRGVETRTTEELKATGREKLTKEKAGYIIEEEKLEQKNKIELQKLKNEQIKEHRRMMTNIYIARTKDDRDKLINIYYNSKEKSLKEARYLREKTPEEILAKKELITQLESQLEDLRTIMSGVAEQYAKEKRIKLSGPKSEKIKYIYNAETGKFELK